MLSVTPSEYAAFIKATYRTNIALMVYGPPGCGKSEIVRQVGQELAQEQGRTYAEWAKLTPPFKRHALDNPADYFIVADERISGMDTTDLRGLPDFNNEKDWLITKPYMWMGYFCKPEASGLLFFDEINLAPPAVAGQAYEVILDRTVSDMKLSDHVNIIAAGNRISDKAGVYEMPMPLRDRFCEIEVEPSLKDWVDWAIKNDINSKLIAFVTFRKKYFYNLDKCGDDKGSSPRGIARASKLIHDCDIESELTKKLISSSCGVGFAVEFMAYVKVFSQLDWKLILAQPSEIINNKTSIDVLIAIACEISSQIASCSDNEKKVWMKNLHKVMLAFPPEYSALAMSMFAKCKDQKFVADWIQSPSGMKVVETLNDDLFP